MWAEPSLVLFIFVIFDQYNEKFSLNFNKKAYMVCVVYEHVTTGLIH